MKTLNEERPRRSPSSGSRVPLTYYRSSEQNAKSNSPFRTTSKKGPFRKLATKFADFIIIGSILLGIIYSLTVRADSSVQAVSSYRPTSVYKTSADTELRHFKNHNKISLDQRQILESLVTKYPEIAAGRVELPVFSQKPKVDLNISPPAFYLQSGSKTYIVNQDGRAVGEQKQFPSIQGLGIVNDQSGFSAESGKQVISASGANFITQLVRQSQKARVSVKAMILPPKTQEIDLETNDRGYYIKFNLNADPDQQIGQFLAARHQFDESSSQPSEYLDARIPGRIFYK